jgi:zinc transporter ZupT
VPASVQMLAINDHPWSRLVVGGWLLMAAATVAGAWLVARGEGSREAWLGAAAGALLVIAGLHLLPDAWSAARAARIWPPAVLGVAMGSFAVSGLAARRGCSCGKGSTDIDGRGTVIALAVHRFLEGSALAVTGSVIVAAALASHALAEGVAAGTLLGRESRRRAGVWLAAMCISPAAGAATASAWLVPVTATPLLLAAAVGVLAQAARMSLRVVHGTSGGSRMAPRTAAALLATAAVTLIATRAIG